MESLALLAVIIVMSLAAITALPGYMVGKYLRSQDWLRLSLWTAATFIFFVVITLTLTPGVILFPAIVFAATALLGFVI
jgi:hypothetical protein